MEGFYEMVQGRHLLVDCRCVAREVCLDDKRMMEIMARAAEAAGMNVISQIRYKFGADSPPGFTAVVMLDASHISCHTYADLGLVAIDVFTCGDHCPEVVLSHIRAQLDLGSVAIRSESRFI